MDFPDKSMKYPFELDRAYGLNLDVPILNLTTTSKGMIFCVANNNTIIEYHCSFPDKITPDNSSIDLTEKYYHGHSNIIHSILCDKTAQYLIGIDDEICNIWDRFSPSITSPTQTIQNPFLNNDNKQNIRYGAFSVDAKYLILSNDNQLQFLCMGDTTNFDENAIIQLVLNESVKSIRFSEITEFFIVTMSQSLLFGQWNNKKIKSQTIAFTSNYNLIDSIFIGCGGGGGNGGVADQTYQINRQGYTITKEGTILFWLESSKNQIQHLKTISLCKSPLQTINLIDENIVAVSDRSGILRFYDLDMKLLFGWEKLKNDYLKSISFNLCKRKYCFKSPFEFNDSDVTNVDNVETLYRENCPRKINNKDELFMIQNFVGILSLSGEVAICDLVNDICLTDKLFASPSKLTAFDIHPSKHWICGGSENGLIYLYDYKLNQILAKVNSEEFFTDDFNGVNAVDDGDNPLPDSWQITCIKFSNKSTLWLACAVGNGFLFILEPLTLKPIYREIQHNQWTRWQPTNKSILKIVFSHNLFAYYDAENVIVVGAYRKNKWKILGKQPHNAKITCIFFTHENRQLITIGNNRCLVEYDLEHKLVDTSSLDLTVLRSFCLEQSAQITAAVLLNKETILTANNQYKFKIFNLKKMKLLRTILGPVCDTPINQIFMLKQQNDIAAATLETTSVKNSFLLFSTSGMFGMYLLPLDGNPYRYIGMPSQSIKNLKILLSHDEKQIISYYSPSSTFYVWNYFVYIVLKHYSTGGSGLTPFISLLSGGNQGWLFKEIQDLFYYFQIISHPKNSSTSFKINEFIRLTDIPDFFRAIGFFPTEFEMKIILDEVTDTADAAAAGGNGEKLLTDKNINVNFEELLKLYLNHRPCFGYSIKNVFDTVTYFAKANLTSTTLAAEDSLSSKSNKTEIDQLLSLLIDRDDLIEMITSLNLDERFNSIEVAKYLSILLSNTDEDDKDEKNYLHQNRLTIRNEKLLNVNELEKLLSNLPEMFTTQEFIENVLGINIYNDL